MKVWPFEPPCGGGFTRVLRWLKTVVVSDAEKAHEMCQVGIRKTVRRLFREFAVEKLLSELR